MNDRQQCWKKEGLGFSKSKGIEVVLQTLTYSDQCVGCKSGLQESFTPVQLLSTFKKNLLPSELALNFDYVSFTIDCARLLDSIAKKLTKKERLEDLIQNKDVRGGDQDYESMVSRLLRSTKDNPMIKMAASLFSDHISRTGKNFIQSASDQSSGRIPKDLRPKIDAFQAQFEDSEIMSRTILEYANTKYMRSGKSMAAYHPSIKHEDCTGICCGGSVPEPGKKSIFVFQVLLFRLILLKKLKPQLKRILGNSWLPKQIYACNFSRSLPAATSLRWNSAKRLIVSWDWTFNLSTCLCCLDGLSALLGHTTF